MPLYIWDIWGTMAFTSRFLPPSFSQPSLSEAYSILTHYNNVNSVISPSQHKDNKDSSSSHTFPLQQITHLSIHHHVHLEGNFVPTPES